MSAENGAGFLDEMGDTLGIKAASDGGSFILTPDSDLRFPNDQAPAIALAILKAAGFVPRGNRPDSDSFHESVDVAAGYLDDAVLIAAGTAAREELNQRRDELAKHLIPVDDATYTLALPAIQRAIDMIVQLQDEATK